MSPPTAPQTLPIARIVQGKNPREYFDPDEMAELEKGIRLFGVIEPIIVRPVPGTDRFEIIAGERRWRAALNVFGDTYDMPVVIKDVSDASAEAMALIENYHRAAMSAAEEARSAQRQLLRNHGDRQETATLMGWSPDVLDRRLALLTCTPAVLKALTTRVVQLGHAELLAGVPPDKQDSVLAGIVAHKVPVSTLKSQLGQYARRLADAVFDTTECSACPHNSARQAALFGESLGDGYCQHPTHFDELTERAVQAKADSLRDEYPVIRIVKPSDGFRPLPVSADGDLGVGATQYGSCQGCQSFGCAVSAMPGSYAEVTRSLCFDAACNSQKVAGWRKARREAAQAGTASAAKTSQTTGKAGTKTAKGTSKRPLPTKPTNHTPQRVVEHRIAQWRKWLAGALMAQPARNQRVLSALALAGRGSDLRTAQFEKAVDKLTGTTSRHHADLGGHLRRADAVGDEHVDRLLQAVTASAALGVDTRNLELLLNHMEVDERQWFAWDAGFLDLFTMSELESLASEVGLKTAMGTGFKAARAGKKTDFIAALLKVADFPYQGTVPAVMLYPRRPVAEPIETHDAGSDVEQEDTVTA